MPLSLFSNNPRFGTLYPDKTSLQPILYNGLIKRREDKRLQVLDAEGYDVYISLVPQTYSDKTLRVELKNKLGMSIPKATFDLMKRIASFDRLFTIAEELAQTHRESIRPNPLRTSPDPILTATPSEETGTQLFKPGLTSVLTQMFSPTPVLRRQPPKP
jgi:hypothetical protein